MNRPETVTKDPKPISHWFHQMQLDDPHAFDRRPSLAQPVSADVCIVGAGYSGLWTAFYLLSKSPGLAVVVLEAEMAGYGASGRNGGAVIAQFNGSRAYWQRRGSRKQLLALEAEVRSTVDEVGTVVASESIDCSFAKNGVVMVARTPLEADRFRRSVEVDQEFGWTAADSEYLSGEAVLERIKVDGAIGARFNAHCASIDPGRLVRGLAVAVERRGGVIYEGTRVRTIEPGRAVTEAGTTVRAKVIVRATEAYTESVQSDRRIFVPVFTSMLATEQIPEALWTEIGWSGREALLAEHPFLHLQHTADHRITIGGDDNRVPYRFGSRPANDSPPPASVFEHYRAELSRLFPSLRGIGIAHSWQGVFAASREWAPSVGIDLQTGLAWLGGYVGEGVANSNLAARTLADLILREDSALTRLPLVSHKPLRRWQPEPLRVVGAVTVGQLRNRGERRERATDRPSKLWDFGNWLAGYSGHIG